MALTKVTGQVIKSDTNITSHNINSSGIITAVSFSGPLDTTGGNFTGIITATSATFSGNVTIGGTLTYEDVTNIDSVGIVTARLGIQIPNDTYKLRSGTELEMQVWHDGTNSVIKDTRNDGKVRIQADNFDVRDKDDAKTMISAGVDGSVSLSHSGNQKLQTTSTGTITTGISTVTGRIDATDNIAITSGNRLYFGNSDVAFVKGEHGGSAYLALGANSEHVRITRDGKVGIGTESPSQVLTVRAGSTPQILLKPTDATPALFVGDTIRTGEGQHLAEYRGNWDGTTVGRMVFAAGADTTNKDDGRLILYTATGGTMTEHFRIDENGNVGINETNPAAYGAFVAKGTGNIVSLNASSGAASLSFFENGTGRFYIKTPNGSDGLSFVDADNSTERFIINSSGVKQIKNGNLNILSTYIDFSGSLASTPQTAAAIFRPADNTLAFSTANNERLRITSAGKVGVNTDSPSAALTVSSPSGGLGDSTIGAGWLDQYDVDCIRVFHNATGRIGVYTIEQGDWSSGIVLGTIDGNTTRKWGIGMASNAKSTHNNGLYFGYREDTSSAGANTFNTMRKDIIIASNGNVNIETGDLIMGTNNKGISFANSSSSPDSTATSSTRIMTDYDEGTCPWELHRDGALTTGSNSSDTRVSYTKIGNRVFMSGYVYTQSTGSSTGVVARLTNASGGVAELPYTAAHDGVMAISKTRTIDDSWRHIAVGFAKDGKQVYVYGDDGNNAYTPEHNNVSINSNQTHLVIAFSGSYETTE